MARGQVVAIKGIVRPRPEGMTNKNLPTGEIEVAVSDLEVLDERALGALMMHFMIETILSAYLLGVDPFDQPAVESGKILTRRYLAGEQAGAQDGNTSAAAEPRQPHRRG